MTRKRILVRGKDSEGVARQTFADLLRTMDDDTFDLVVRRTSWLASFARTQPSSDFHWQLDVCAREAAARGRPIQTRAQTARDAAPRTDARDAATV